jgi:hypothetical protein
MPQKEWLVEAKRLASQMLSDWRMFERDGSVKSTEALAASEKFLGHLSLRLAQPAQPVEIAWTGNDGAHFSLSLESAQAELCALFDRFPNGVDEMEASLSAWRERAVAPAQPAADAARPAAQTALSDEQIAVRGRFDVAVALLRECLGPLEVSAAIIESDDGEPMEALIRRVKTFVSAASAPEEPAEPVPAQPKRSDPKNCTARVNCDNGIITTRSCTTQRPLIDKGGSSDGERDYYECPDCGKSITIDYREN